MLRSWACWCLLLLVAICRVEEHHGLHIRGWRSRANWGRVADPPTYGSHGGRLALCAEDAVPEGSPAGFIQAMRDSVENAREEGSEWARKIRKGGQASLDIYYNYLADNALETTGVQGRSRQQAALVRQWWIAARKWRLLTGRWERLDELLDNIDLNHAINLYRIGSPFTLAEVLRCQPRTAAHQAVDDAVLATLRDEIAQALSYLPPSSSPLPRHVHGNYNRSLLFQLDVASAASPEVSLYDDCLPSRTAILDAVLLHTVRKLSQGQLASVLAVGDVHGCVEELIDLLREAQFGPGDLLVLLGDLVAKGLHSALVLQLALDMDAVGVRGNHDQGVLHEGHLLLSGKARNFVGHHAVARSLTADQFNYLARQPFYVRSDDLGALFVHAGLDMNVELSLQQPWTMMTLRNLKPGPRTMHIFAGRGAAEAPRWCEHWPGPWTVYYGHDASANLRTNAYALCLDTGCVYGGRLTGVMLPEQRIVSVPARREYLRGKAKG